MISKPTRAGPLVGIINPALLTLGLSKCTHILFLAVDIPQPVRVKVISVGPAIVPWLGKSLILTLGKVMVLPLTFVPVKVGVHATSSIVPVTVILTGVCANRAGLVMKQAKAIKVRMDWGFI